MFATPLSLFAALVALFFISSAAIPMLSICYKPGTDLSEFQEHRRYELMGTNSRWSSTVRSGSGLTMGLPTILTWSIVPDGMQLDGGVGEAASPSNLKATFTNFFGSQQALVDNLQKAFDAWSAVGGLTFYHEGNDDGAYVGSVGQTGVRGDIRIGGHYIDGNSGTLAYTWGPDLGFMVIDTGDGHFQSNPAITYLTVEHELGHAFGLMHSCPATQTKLMEPVFASNILAPQHDDIRGIHHFYGDRYEGVTMRNDVITSAKDIGTVSSSLFVDNLSLDSQRDVDYYRFTVGGASSTITVSLNPIGKQYPQGPQTEAGCPSYPDENSNVFDIQVQLLDGSGNVLKSAVAGAPGVQVSISAVQMSAASTGYIRVFTASISSSETNSVQMYSLSINSVTAVSPSRSPSTSRSRSATPSRSSSPTSQSPTRSYTPSRSSSPISQSPTRSYTPSRSPSPSPPKVNFTVKQEESS